MDTQHQPTWTIEGDGELSDEAIAALARLLLDVVEQEQPDEIAETEA